MSARVEPAPCRVGHLHEAGDHVEMQRGENERCTPKGEKDLITHPITNQGCEAMFTETPKGMCIRQTTGQ